MVRDSAGVEIVENYGPENAAGSFWAVEREPEFILGAVSDVSAYDGQQAERDDLDGNIFSVTGIARLVDGRIAVLSRDNHQVLIFDSSGKLTRAFGRRGTGPGEFRGPQHLQYLPPDTLVVWDAWMGPVTRFDTAGTLLDQTRIDLARTMEAIPGANAESPTTPLLDGSLVVAAARRDPAFQRPPDGTLFRYPPIEYVHIDVTGDGPATSLGLWDGPEMLAVPGRIRDAYPGDVGDRPANVDMFLDSHVAGGPESIYVTNGDADEIHAYGMTGQLQRIISARSASADGFRPGGPGAQGVLGQLRQPTGPALHGGAGRSEAGMVALSRRGGHDRRFRRVPVG